MLHIHIICYIESVFFWWLDFKICSLIYYLLYNKLQISGTFEVITYKCKDLLEEQQCYCFKILSLHKSPWLQKFNSRTVICSTLFLEKILVRLVRSVPLEAGNRGNFLWDSYVFSHHIFLGKMFGNTCSSEKVWPSWGTTEWSPAQS